eukprot:TRINITY_DN50865_c0_g1_i1.p1 TRINITY_DN50865_c0_g1~~TRINITY_DN50865_c0_g1_i1.p1  ORF type:complete len:316 (+),score=48.65 TRINITY_DN50865_c0_g1_i1:174-1121(+)
MCIRDRYLELTQLLASAYSWEGNPSCLERALELLEEFVSLSKERGEASKLELSQVHQEIANCCCRLGRFGDACGSLSAALSVTVMHHGDWSVEAQSVGQRLEIVQAEARTRELTELDNQLLADVRALRHVETEPMMAPAREPGLGRGSPPHDHQIPGTQVGRRVGPQFGLALIRARRGALPGTPPNSDPLPLFHAHTPKIARKQLPVHQPEPGQMIRNGEENSQKRSSSINLEPLPSLLPPVQHGPAKSRPALEASRAGSPRRQDREELKPDAWPSSLKAGKHRQLKSLRGSSGKKGKKRGHRKQRTNQPLTGYR